MRRAVCRQHGKGLYFIFTLGQVLNVGIGDVIGPHACRGDAQAAQRPWTGGNAGGLEYRFAGIVIADGQRAGITQGRCCRIFSNRANRIARDNWHIIHCRNIDTHLCNNNTSINRIIYSKIKACKSCSIGIRSRGINQCIQLNGS